MVDKSQLSNDWYIKSKVGTADWVKSRKWWKESRPYDDLKEAECDFTCVV